MNSTIRMFCELIFVLDYGVIKVNLRGSFNIIDFKDVLENNDRILLSEDFSRFTPWPLCRLTNLNEIDVCKN